jgi:HK97 family phage major capsid protein
MSDPKKRGQGSAGEILQRSLSIESFEKKRMDGDDSPEIYEFKLSSEAEVEVWHREIEILSHAPEAVRMDFIQSGNAPLLWMHDRGDPRGILPGARLEGGFLYVMARFGESEKAQELKKDVDAGIIKNVSVGYRVHAYRFVEERADGFEIFEATDWEPLEASFVTIPADKTVGMGRSRSLKDLLSEGDKPEKSNSESRQQSKTMSEIKDPPKPPIDLEKERGDAAASGAAAERKRMSHIREIASKTKIPGIDLGEIAERALNDDTSVEAFRSEVLELIQRNAPKLNQIDMGASKKDQKRYSITNVINGIRNGNLDKVAGYEMEVSEELKSRMGKDGSTIAIPHDVLLRGWIPRNEQALAVMARNYGMSQRDLQAVTLNGAGQSNTSANIVETELMDEMFVYSLRETSALLDSGVTLIPGLVGNIEIPVELLNPDFYWIGEDAEPTEGDYGLGKVGLNFKTLAARIPFTRQADKQTMPGLENLLLRNVRIGAGLGLASGFYSGTGAAGQPTGILNTAGVGSVDHDNTSTRDNLIDLEIALGNANVTGEAATFMNTTRAGAYAKTKVDAGSGQFVGRYRRGARRLLETEIGDVNIDNLVPDNTDIHGIPSSLIAGMWGTLEVGIDTSTKVATGGKVVRVFLDADCCVPQPAHWVVGTNVV